MSNEKVQAATPDTSPVATKKPRKPRTVKAKVEPDEKAKTRLVVQQFSKKYGLEEASVIPMVIKTSFSEILAEDIKHEEVLAFMLACIKYDLDPFMREIYALESWGRHIPSVGNDGWNKIVQRQENYGSKEFKYSPDVVTVGKVSDCPTWIECEIYTTDFDRPTVAREYLSGNYRETEYWIANPQRMLHIRAFIQCAKSAFALTGIGDAEEIRAENFVKRTKARTPAATTASTPSLKKAGGASEPVTGGLQAAKKDSGQNAAAATSSANGTTLFEIE